MGICAPFPAFDIGEWQDFPLGGTNFARGNATVYGARYVQIGSTVRGYFWLSFGSTSSVTGAVQVNLPVPAMMAAPAGVPIGTGLLVGPAGAQYDSQIQIANSTRMHVYAKLASGTYVSVTALSSTVPFTWGTGHAMLGSFEYEAA